MKPLLGSSQKTVLDGYLIPWELFCEEHLSLPHKQCSEHSEHMPGLLSMHTKLRVLRLLHQKDWSKPILGTEQAEPSAHAQTCEHVCWTRSTMLLEECQSPPACHHCRSHHLTWPAPAMAIYGNSSVETHSSVKALPADGFKFSSRQCLQFKRISRSRTKKTVPETLSVI